MASPASPPELALQERLNYRFRDPGLLREALTHPSYRQDHPNKTATNQRLEFLGDAVILLILAEALFQRYPGEQEGFLTTRRAALAKGPFLAQLARELDLGAGLSLGKSEEANDGRAKASTLEDAFEALVGALYLDSDLATARRVVLGVYGDLELRLAGVDTQENPKGQLQERIQPLYGNGALRYEVVSTAGADHARAFEVAVYFQERQIGQGRGTSKKLAEEAAARAALDALAAPPCPPSPPPAQG